MYVDKWWISIVEENEHIYKRLFISKMADEAYPPMPVDKSVDN